MGDVDDGGLQLLVQLLDLGAHVDAQLGVEVRQRLVEQEDVGVAHQRPAHGDALALAAGELAGLAVEQVLDLQELGDLVHRLVALGLRHAVHLEAEDDVLPDVHVRVERVGLEHHGDVAVGRAHADHRAALDRDLAGGDLLQPRDHVEQRGLAAARGADQHQELALLDRDVGLVEDLHRAVGFGGALDVEKSHGLILSRSPPSARARSTGRRRRRRGGWAGRP